MRQLELIKLCEQRKPKAILEIGCFDGKSGIYMINAAGAEIYVGFDLFTEATAENDAAEFNFKPHPVMWDVMAAMREACPNTDIELVQGNTHQTLPEFVQRCIRKFDMAFIDGGHSIATVEHDWHCVKQLMAPDGVVIFDDFYTNRDVSQFGCNRVVQRLPFVVLPEVDQVFLENVASGELQLAQVEMRDIVRLGL